MNMNIWRCNSPCKEIYLQYKPIIDLQMAQMSSKMTPHFKINPKKHSNRQWLLRQINDPYVKRARIADWRCRSAFKLIELDDKLNLLKPGTRVVDCGASPGSWSQVAASRVLVKGNTVNKEEAGLVISVDRNVFTPVPGCITLTKADITDPRTLMNMNKFLDGKKLDVILSDMAPNSSGQRDMDHERIMQLNHKLLELCGELLDTGGSFICKAWSGRETEQFHKIMETLFEKARYMKPGASRTDSAEIYHVGLGYKNPKMTSQNPNPPPGSGNIKNNNGG